MPTPTVLVVDDDPVILRLLEVTFELEGFAVLVAHNGAEGIEAARAQRPDLVITDLTMPGVSGPDVVAALKGVDATQGIPIIVLSTTADANDLATGADDEVTKPFEPSDLIGRANALLHR